MKKENPNQSRREFLHKIGEVGGTAAVYQAMVSMGLLVSGEAQAGSTRLQWNERSAQLENITKAHCGNSWRRHFRSLRCL